MGRVYGTALGLLVLLLAAAGDAAAATVEVQAIYNRAAYAGDRLDVRGGPGELNRVTIAQAAPHVLRVADVVPIQPGRGCLAESPLVVRCTAGQILGVLLEARLGDGDDSLDAAGMAASFGRVDGGPGDDQLVGLADGETRFRGGPGNDVMQGGARGDTFLESPEPNGSDTFQGGDAAVPRVLLTDDAVDYSPRRRGIRADLDGDRDDGGARERDLIATDIERVVGGKGPDRLFGNGGDNQLAGGLGRDVLRGGAGADLLDSGGYGGARAVDDDVVLGGPGDDRIDTDRGDDRLDGGTGHDSLQAGPGDDRIRALDSTLDAVLCGGGRDRVAHDASDWLAGDCERQGAIPARVVPLSWADAGDRLFLVLGCPFHRGKACRAEATLEVAGQAFGPRAFTLRPGRYGWLLLALGARTRENPTPPLDDGVIALTSADRRGRVATVRVPLSAVHREPNEFSFFLPPVLPFL